MSKNPFRIPHSGWLLVLVLVVLAAGLRLYQLPDRSLWADELFSASVANDHPIWPVDGVPYFERLRILDVRLGQSFWTVKAADQSPPLFELLAKGSIQLFGLGEFAVRLPSVVAGVLLVAWFAWWAALAGSVSERRAFGWAALWCALAPGLLHYGQEARVYALGTLWSGMFATWLFLRARRGWHTMPLPGWGEIAVFVLACYSHNNLIVLSGVLLTAYGIEALRRRDYRAVGRMLCVPLAYLPWLTLSYHTLIFTMDRGIAWADLTWVQAVVEMARSLLYIVPGAWLLTVVGVPALWLVFRLLRARSGVPGAAADWVDSTADVTADLKANAALMAAVLAYVLLLAVIISRSGVYHYRHILYLVPFAALFAGVVLAQVKAWWLQLALALTFTASAVPGLKAAFNRPTHDFRSAYRFALGNVSANAPVVGITPADRRFYVDLQEPNSKRELVFLVDYVPDVYSAACDRLIAAGTDTAVVTVPLREPYLKSLFGHCRGVFEVAERFTGDHVIAERWRRVVPTPGSQAPAPSGSLSSHRP